MQVDTPATMIVHSRDESEWTAASRRSYHARQIQWLKAGGALNYLGTSRLMLWRKISTSNVTWQGPTIVVLHLHIKGSVPHSIIYSLE